MCVKSRARRKCFAAFVALAGLAQAAYCEVKTAFLPDGWWLAVEVAAGWRVVELPTPHSVTLRFFTNKEPEHPTLQLTVFPLPHGREARPIAELKRKVEEQGEELLSTATQESIEVKPISLSSGAVFYYHLTDREAERGPGDFKELHQGFGEMSTWTFVFTVLTHTGETQLVQSALDSVASISITKGR